MRVITLLAATLVLAGCGTMQYEDTNAAVDRRAECISSNPQPGEPVPPWCEREQSASWSSDSGSTPVDFSGEDGNDD